MNRVAVTATPASEDTAYFEVPIVHFRQNSHPPMPEAASPAQVEQSSGAAGGEKHDVQATEPDIPLRETSRDSVVRKVSVLISKSSPATQPPIDSSSFTDADQERVDGSTFTGGAATTGTVGESEGLHRRAASLTPKQRSKMEKLEAKSGKRLSKIIKGEAMAEKKVLSVAINELAELQKLQKQSIKTEEKVHSVHTKVLSQLQKEETAYLTARTKYEATQARLQSEEEALERLRSTARGLTERLQEKSQEVDGLRTTYAVDERERATKLAELAEHSSGCF